MLTFNRTGLRVKTSFKSKKRDLVREIKNHSAWKDDVSLCEAAALLKGHSCFTYTLSQGMDECHFFLSYVDSDRVVKHKNVRVLIDQGGWVVKNGLGTSFDSIYLLIPSCLHCSNSVCKALTA